MAITDFDAVRLRTGIAGGEFSSREVTQSFLDRIERLDPSLNAFLHVDPDDALRRAEAIDRRLAAGDAVGPLAGVPVAVKDNICVRDAVTTCASRVLEHWRPPYQAHTIDRLEQAGAVLLGKTNLDEFAMGSSTENSGFGPTRNPWNTGRVPGGSSGGSAAAVAARMAPIAVGSDTGGSIRQPASLCGVAGLKPTYGRVSRYGLVAFGSSLDQIGPIGRSARDMALLLQALAGHDRRDETSINRPVPDYPAALDRGVAGMKIGVIKECFAEGTSSGVAGRVREAVAKLEELGAEVEEVSIPRMQLSVDTYYVVATAEASSNLARYDGVHYGHRTEREGSLIDLYSRSRAEGFGPEVKRRIMLGTYVLSAGYVDAYYKKALSVREVISRDFQEAFKKVDVVVGPVSPTTAWGLGEKVDDPLAMYLSDIDTLAVNLAGLPGLSIPCGFDDEGLPVGLQAIGNYFEEDKLLAVESAFEEATGFQEIKPRMVCDD